MLKELSDIWARLRVRWHAVVLALAAVLPALLYHLEGIDVRPILAHFLPENYVEIIVALLPFVLALLKPMIHLEEPQDD
jgi:hypothetical protein